MIKVNLGERKKAKSAAKLALSKNYTPVVLVAIAAGFVGYGYWWYSSLNDQIANLDNKIKQAQAQKAPLDNVIKQDQIYETRKKTLENRVKVIEGLQKGQVSPVMTLDQLSEAVQRTQYARLSNLDQNNAVLTMNGVGTSLNAIADFYTNLTATGYFKNIDVSNVQDSAGNFMFSLKCEFSPPRSPAPAGQPAAAGGN
jgi:Tfp pilus assembly protein PilN